LRQYAAEKQSQRTDLLQPVTWPVATATTDDKPQPNKETINIGARLRGMWQ
jgi:hypothetical protein